MQLPVMLTVPVLGVLQSFFQFVLERLSEDCFLKSFIPIGSINPDFDLPFFVRISLVRIRVIDLIISYF